MDANYVERELPASPTSVHRARIFVHEVLERWKFEDRDSVVALLTSELVTNAIRNSSHCVTVRIALDGCLLRVEALDDNTALPTVMPLDPMSESGRGMYMVENLSRHWGAEQRGPATKAVWFEVEVSPRTLPPR